MEQYLRGYSAMIRTILIDDVKLIREDLAKGLNAVSGIRCQFLHYDNNDVDKTLKDILSRCANIDLIIIDHILSNSLKSMITTGSSLAEIIRNLYPHIPIIGITGMGNLALIDIHQSSSYDELFTNEQLLNYSSKLKAIAEGYKTLKKMRSQNIDYITRNLLFPPDTEYDKLMQILPGQLRDKNINQGSWTFEFSKWIRQRLLTYPGLLYDRLWTTTFLGLKEPSFQKVEKLFGRSIYQGIYSDENDPRWWVGSLRMELYKKIKVDSPQNSWDMGRKLPGIKAKDFSECYVCKGKMKGAPEIVGYRDQESESREQMHLSCSKPHPKHEISLFFEDVRIINDAPKN